MARIFADRVMENTTTTGTGELTLAGAVTGFQTFDAVCATGDTFDYALFGVDERGTPTGQWETGVGTFTAGGGVTRDPSASSNAGAAVDLSTGTKHLILSLNAESVGGLGSLPVSVQAGTAYTAAAGDANSYLRFTAASAVTFTLPPSTSAAFPVGTVIEVEQAGVGTLSVAPGSGVTINSRSADLTLAGQYAVAFVKKVGADTWTMNGDL